MTLILRIMLAAGIAGHGLNMYCDRILSIFPNGTVNFSNIKDIKKGDTAAKLMEGVSPEIPLRSSVLGAFALVMEFFGYLSLAIYTYGFSHVQGIIMFLSVVFSCIVGAAYHVKCGIAEYVFLKLGRDDKAKELMLDLLYNAPVLRSCAVGLIVYLIVLIVAIVSGTIGFPVWAVIFTVIPVAVVLFPLKIIGTLHIAAMVSMLAWMFLI